MSVLIVLILTVMSACEHKEATQSKHSPRYVFFAYNRNFKMNEIRMSRVFIDVMPSQKYAFYIMTVYVEGCNQEMRKRDKEQEGRILRPFDRGLNDTIYRLEFKKREEVISPKPLKWKTLGEKENFSMQISKIKADDAKLLSVFYNGDYEHLSLNLIKPTKYAEIRNSEIKNNKDSLFYLITFDVKQPLPDSAIIVLPGKNINVVVDNSSVIRYKMISHSSFRESKEIVLRKLHKAREERMNKRYLKHE